MKSLASILALVLIPACTTITPVCEQKQTAEQFIEVAPMSMRLTEETCVKWKGEIGTPRVDSGNMANPPEIQPQKKPETLDDRRNKPRGS